jgi:hypothetical protein
MDRVARMSESAAKLLLVQILLTNEAARRQFHEVSVSSSAARPLPDVMLPGVGASDENEFEQEIEAINQLIYGDDSDEEDEPWNPMSACDLEEEVEAAFDAIETACAEEEWSDVGMVPRVVAFSTKLDGLKALFGNGRRNARGKEETGHRINDELRSRKSGENDEGDCHVAQTAREGSSSANVLRQKSEGSDTENRTVEGRVCGSGKGLALWIVGIGGRQSKERNQYICEPLHADARILWLTLILRC